MALSADPERPVTLSRILLTASNCLQNFEYPPIDGPEMRMKSRIKLWLILLTVSLFGSGCKFPSDSSDDSIAYTITFIGHDLRILQKLEEASSDVALEVRGSLSFKVYLLSVLKPDIAKLTPSSIRTLCRLERRKPFEGLESSKYRATSLASINYLKQVSSEVELRLNDLNGGGGGCDPRPLTPVELPKPTK